MAHSWFPVLSPSVFSPFLCVMFFWSNNISQWMALLWSAVIVIACTKKKTPLGVPISIQIQLSIQGNNINHIISYHDDKVGLALSVSCRKSSASFFLFLLDLAQCTCIHAGVYEWQIAVWYPNNVGGVLSYVTGAQGKLQGTPLPPVSHDGLVLISGEKLRCTVIKKRVLTNFFPSLCISFFPDRGMTSCQLCQLLRGLFLIVRSDLLGFYFESSAILIAMPSLQWVWKRFMHAKQKLLWSPVVVSDLLNQNEPCFVMCLTCVSNMSLLRIFLFFCNLFVVVQLNMSWIIKLTLTSPVVGFLKSWLRLFVRYRDILTLLWTHWGKGSAVISRGQCCATDAQI